jgi:cytochrome P450
MFHDESVYPDAHTFNPERFLKDGQINPDVKDPEQMLFGYSRRYFHSQRTPIHRITRGFSRICPGRFFALRVLFLTVASLLATFDISKCLDEDGNPIVPEENYTLGLAS